MLKPLGDRVVLKIEEKEEKVGGFVIAGNSHAATKTATGCSSRPREFVR